MQAERTPLFTPARVRIAVLAMLAAGLALAVGLLLLEVSRDNEGWPFVGASLASVAALVAFPWVLRRHASTRGQLERERELFTTAFQGAPIGVVIVSSDPKTRGTLMRVNRAFCEITGRDEHELIGAHMLSLTAREDHQTVLKAVGRLMGGESSVEFSKRYVRPDGERVWVDVQLSSIRDADGAPLFNVGHEQDVTGRKTAERRLAEAEERYRNLVERVPGVTYVAEPGHTGKWLYVSPQIESLLGYSPDEWTADPELWYSRIHPDDRTRIVEAEADHSTVGERLVSEYRLCRRDGSEVWVVDDGVLRESGTGALVLEGMLYDITGRKQAEGAAEEARARLVEAQSLAHIGSWEWDVTNDTITWSEELYRIFGVSPAEFVPSFEAFLEHVPPGEREGVRKLVWSAHESRSAFSYGCHIVRPDGEVRFLESRGEVVTGKDGAVVRMFGTSHDLTEQKRAEEEVRSSRARMAAVLDGISSIVYMKDTSFRHVLANRTFEESFGLEPGATTGVTDDEIFPPEVVEAIRADDRRVIETGESFEREEIIPIRGSEHVFLTHKFPIVAADGEIQGVGGISTDITAQRRTAEELRRRAEQQATVAELGGCVISDMKLSELMNEATGAVARILDADFVKVLELAPEGDALVLRSAVGLDSELIGAARVAADTTTQAGYTLHTGGPVIVEDLGTETRFHGSSLLHEHGVASGVSARIEGEQGAFGVLTVHTRAPRSFTKDEVSFVESVANVLGAAIMRDRAERLELQLHQAQRLESVGQLAGGIAHDFNNLLAVILNYASFAIDTLPDDEPARADIQEIEKAAKRAADLTRQLLVFSRREVVTPQVLNVNSVVIDTENLLRRTLGEHVELRTNLDPGIRDIEIGSGRLEQILVNLAVNARDAMPDGGVLEVMTENMSFLEPAVQGKYAIPAGNYVRLTVADTGVGMPKEVAEQAFDPFFTTKPKGEGTGLGLATVYGAVAQANGYITLYSEPGQGTNVRVYLPTTEALPPSTRENAHNGHTEGTGESILLVEDEDAVRRLTERILSENGYDVVPATDGESALQEWESRGRRIDLLLTDVVMPRMSGKELANRMRVRQPDLKALYMSGYPNDVIARRGVLDEGVLLLEKPFDSHTLLTKIRSALDGNGSEARDA